MFTEYDFIQNINTLQLLDEITTAGIPLPNPPNGYISTYGSAVQIFYSSPLTPTQQTTLSTVVANHVANPNYIPLAQQAQITTLLGYLNNSNLTVANTARAVIVANIAPQLPVGLMTTINAEIAALVGS